MAKTLPFTAQTAGGATIDFRFPLHKDTASPMRVSQLVTTLLGALDRDVRTLGETANGDILQALAMTLAVRAAMIPAPALTTATMAQQLVDEALGAIGTAEHGAPDGGKA
ncbi:hypothetical protein [Oceanibaculum pacificum]|uniref:Uncharacterized protein n=1 Tax=Oceanibaculum pacificum TaxID=580166 RepID=A0A154WER5_9PROT|nr:hypothetical protein [Oceanibaculum pacificum]KZD12018.1 hypothetical protein AUP43_17650 [Oceanibaculum pacificum]